MTAFKIHFPGNMHEFELYDERGQKIEDLQTAIAEADRQFPGEPWEVYNGDEGMTNKEYNKLFTQAVRERIANLRR